MRILVFSFSCQFQLGDAEVCQTHWESIHESGLHLHEHEVWEDDSDPDDGQFSSAADQQLDGWVRNF